MLSPLSPPAELPTTLPLFPLKGSILLPDCQLPLNIFEPRYVQMVMDALTRHRLIGMVQPSSALRQGGQLVPLYRTGCAGKISYFEEMPDGRLMIALQGVSRFHLQEELPIQHGYRRATVDWSAFTQDRNPSPMHGIDLEGLMSTLKRYILRQGVEMDIRALEGVAPYLVVNALSTHLPLSDGEKQALLESPTDEERALLLLNIMQMECHMPSVSAMRQ
jgi:Lon protease-like protein